jgi:hypothetical protein
MRKLVPLEVRRQPIRADPDADVHYEMCPERDQRHDGHAPACRHASQQDDYADDDAERGCRVVVAESEKPGAAISRIAAIGSMVCCALGGSGPRDIAPSLA